MRIEGNPLLASLGLLGKEFSDSVIELSALAGGEADLYRDPPGATLLVQVQRDILSLRGGGSVPERLAVDPADRSIRLHACHSPLREVEVLHDQLLALFAEKADLTPRDILVMTPDIETYAPFIAAVFDGCQEPAKKIPYSIADRSIRQEGGLAATFLAILKLPGRRFPVTAVMEILASPAGHARFGIGTEDLDPIRAWLEETRVRWGMDGEERRRAGPRAIPASSKDPRDRSPGAHPSARRPRRRRPRSRRPDPRPSALVDGRPTRGTTGDPR